MCALVMLSLLIVSTAAVGHGMPKEPMDALRLTFPHHEPNRDYVSVGDLTNDGIPEIATLLGNPHYDKQEKQDSEIRIAVTSKTAIDRYSILALSPELPWDPNVFYFTKIKSESLFLLTSGTGWTDNYQFKWKDKEFFLIGETTLTFGPGDTPSVRTSFNFLTGKVLLTQTIGKHHTEKIGKFETTPLVRLRKFDLGDEFLQTKPSSVVWLQNP